MGWLKTKHLVLMRWLQMELKLKTCDLKTIDKMNECCNVYNVSDVIVFET